MWSVPSELYRLEYSRPRYSNSCMSESLSGLYLILILIFNPVRMLIVNCSIKRKIWFVKDQLHQNVSMVICVLIYFVNKSTNINYVIIMLIIIYRQVHYIALDIHVWIYNSTVTFDQFTQIPRFILQVFQAHMTYDIEFADIILDLLVWWLKSHFPIDASFAHRIQKGVHGYTTATANPSIWRIYVRQAAHTKHMECLLRMRFQFNMTTSS